MLRFENQRYVLRMHSTTFGRERDWHIKIEQWSQNFTMNDVDCRCRFIHFIHLWRIKWNRRTFIYHSKISFLLLKIYVSPQFVTKYTYSESFRSFAFILELIQLLYQNLMVLCLYFTPTPQRKIRIRSRKEHPIFVLI